MVIITMLVYHNIYHGYDDWPIIVVCVYCGIILFCCVFDLQGDFHLIVQFVNLFTKINSVEAFDINVPPAISYSQTYLFHTFNKNFKIACKLNK